MWRTVMLGKQNGYMTFTSIRLDVNDWTIVNFRRKFVGRVS